MSIDASNSGNVNFTFKFIEIKFAGFIVVINDQSVIILEQNVLIDKGDLELN